MLCPCCGTKTIVKDSRTTYTPGISMTFRVRECPACKLRYNSVETVKAEYAREKKKNSMKIEKGKQ